MLRLTLEVPEVGHVVLCVDLLLFYFRLLRVLTVSRSIGPMLPMIWNMVSLLTVMHTVCSVVVITVAVSYTHLTLPTRKNV